MPGLSFISLDADKAEPLIIIAVAAVAGWWLYNKAQQAQAASQQAQAAASSTQGYINSIEQGALLSQLFGGGQTTNPVVNQQTGQVASAPVYTAPISTRPAPASGTIAQNDATAHGSGA